ncbi:hypothetical protein [Benzoatithermus flavus]|uniref:Uncharacterized protein n=1 Tax=Benzoatithermus flavus TaxID=3108223 RepID=A0ABU8XPT8_9PROT
MRTETEIPPETPFTAQELRERTERRRRELIRIARQNGNGPAEDDQRRRRFLNRRLAGQDIERFVQLVENAIALGRSECQVLRFPSAWTTDRGRAINCFEPDWHETLVGFAAEVHAYYVRCLAPKGFSIRAQIVTWPEGLPGEVGVFIGW